MEADLAGNQDLPARAARRDRHDRRAGRWSSSCSAALGQRAGQAPDFVGPDLPIMAALLIALSAVLSLVTILAIYREGGILKRLRATPLRPHTILSAHVIVKLLITLATMLALIAGREALFPPQARTSDTCRSRWRVLFSTLSHPLDRLRRRQRRPDRAVRAAGRHAAVLSDGRAVAACSFRSRSCRRYAQALARRPAAELCRVADEGDLAGRGVARAHGRSGGAGRRVR